MRHPISRLCDQWLETKSHLAPRTLLAYGGEIARFEEFCVARKVGRVEQLSFDLWRAYVIELRAGRSGTRSKRVETLNEGSAQQAQRITRAFLAWLREEGRIRWSVPEPAWGEARDVPGSSSSISREPAVSGPRQIELPSSLLGKAIRGGAESDLRARVTTNLLFWAALKPAELATLRIDGLSRTQGGLTQVMLPESDLPRFAPSHVWLSWMRYRRARESRCGGGLLPHEPVLCALQGRRAVTPWTIWSIVKSVDVEFARTPRDLRSEYLCRLTVDAAVALKSARDASGLSKLQPLLTAAVPTSSNAQIVSALTRAAR